MLLAAAGEYAEGRARTDFLLTALKIGVLSLRAARRVVDGDRAARRRTPGHAAAGVASALCVPAAQHDKDEAASFGTIDKAVQIIRKQIEGFEVIRTCATTSRNAADKVLERGRIMEDSLLKQLETVCEEVAKLKAAHDKLD